MRHFAIFGIAFLFNVILSAHAEIASECKPHNQNSTIKIADTKQCDKYYDCTKAGKAIERLCRDGYVYSDPIQQCDFPFKVNCGDRTDLQPPQSTNPLCERLYGLYPFSPQESCAKFYHCQEGIAYEKECPDTSIYDPTIGTCVHPGAANRKDCSASQVFNYQCPNFGKKFAKLRFYDHDRLKHPEDCRKYLACFTDGQPRLLSCPYKTVFYEKIGRCIKYLKHPDPECKSYYKKGGKGYKEETEDDDASIDEIAVDSDEDDSHEHQELDTQNLKKVKSKSKRQNLSQPKKTGSNSAHLVQSPNSSAGSRRTNNSVDRNSVDRNSVDRNSQNSQNRGNKKTRAPVEEDDDEEEED